MTTLKTLIINLAILGGLGLTGCATQKAPNRYVSPAITKVTIPVEKTKNAIEKAKYSLDKQDYQATKKNLIEAETHAETVEQELGKYQLLVEDQTKQLNTAVDDKNKAELRAETKAKEAHQNAKERDVLVYLWAVFFALWLLATMDTITDALPLQYRTAGKVVFLLVGFGSGYALGRYILHWLAYLFP